jgi:monoamine oxidase
MRISARTSRLLPSLLLASQFVLPDSILAHAVPTKDKGEACRPTDVDVVVVGGGFSGLASAYSLHKAGLKVAVIEAKDRLGGRSRSIPLSTGPGIVELGATWINNSTQPAVFALTQEFGLETIEQYNQGLDIRQSIDGSIESQSEEEIANVSGSSRFLD